MPLQRLSDFHLFTRSTCAQFFIVAILILTGGFARGEGVEFSPTGDSTQRVRISGYTDVYFCYDFAAPPDANIPYFVSQNRHNEFNINLAYLKIKYTSSRARATLMPAFGTFMNSNFAGERNTLQHLLEASVGVKLFKDKGIWVDVGVIASPYTNESEISFEQLTLTRSFGSENVPYYQTGARLTVPMGNRFTTYLFLLNGWQVISDVNNSLAFGSQCEYTPTDELTFDLNTFYGNENSAAAPNNHMRSFLDFYAMYNTGPWSLAWSSYVGNQRRSDSLGNMSDNIWWQSTLSGKYAITEAHSFSARVEYFHDPKSVMITPITGVKGFTASSISLGYNLAVTPVVVFRVEARYFQSPDKVFEASSDHHTMLTGGLTAKF